MIFSEIQNVKKRAFTLEFDGYYTEDNKEKMPKASGVYCVQSSKKESDGKQYWDEILYIGQADDINDRFSNHERLEDWKTKVKKGGKLWYSYTLIESDDLDRVEAALIFHHKPPFNDRHVNHFGYAETEVTLGGKRGKLDAKFTVHDDRKHS